jgi:hypothetical protein
MKTVTVTKAEFIERVSANREKHRAVFESAQEGFRTFLIKEFEQRLDDARKGLKVDRFIRVEEPEDHTDDYDTVLEMARMSVDEILEVTQQEFAWYVLDKWTWKQQWAATASAYTVMDTQ